MGVETPRRRGRRHHTDEQLLAYLAASPEQKLRWLHAMWRFNADFLTAEARWARDQLRGRPPGDS